MADHTTGKELPVEPDPDDGAGLAVEQAETEPRGMDALVDAPPETTNGAVAPPLALYRRYRPDTFDDLIGQEHVTEPLQRALENNRVNHAYLFSGPRGCGKTTSARILARALNCAQGPVAEPCGECQSCRDLATGGSGSIDVIEIDAASHGGVDDARDLRERAFFAPVNSRYKVYVIDEAHMVTSAGFNALLRLVEEPPPHVKFVFATTEPDKVIGTIRSRTHHYPFRLVPPRLLGDYLATVCTKEGIEVEGGVLPLVVRAGAGSVRDSLSVLDQLLGGAEARGVSYRQAAALLGYTPDSLLDEMLDAVAAGDSAGVFRGVDKVIEIGQDPRRFAEDLLRRVRDLVIVASVPDALSSGLLDVADDQAERLSSQAATLGAGELTRAGEVLAAGLTQMRGTTAPRLHLELMCARILLPATDVDDRGVHARLERLERRLGMRGTGPPAAVEDLPPAGAAVAADPQQRGEAFEEPPAVAASGPAADHDERVADPASAAAAQPGPSSADHGDEPDERATGGHPRSEPGRLAAATTSPEQSDRNTPSPPPAAPAGATPAESSQDTADDAPGDASTQQTAGAPGRLTLTDLRRLWPQVLEEVKQRRRVPWMVLSQNAHVADLSEGTLVLALTNSGARDMLARSGNEDILHQALVAVIGSDLDVRTMTDPSAGGSGGGTSGGAPEPATAAPAGSSSADPPSGQPGPAAGGHAQQAPRGSGSDHDASGHQASVWDPPASPATGGTPSTAGEPGTESPGHNQSATWQAGPESREQAEQSAPDQTRPGPVNHPGEQQASDRPHHQPAAVTQMQPPPPADSSSTTAATATQTLPARPETSALHQPQTAPAEPERPPSGEQHGEPAGASARPPAASSSDGAGSGADWTVRDAAAHRDDTVLEESAESQTELLRRRLGAEVIAEDGPDT